MLKKRDLIVFFMLFPVLMFLSGCSDPVTETEAVDINGAETISVEYSSTNIEVEQGSADKLEAVLETDGRGPKLSLSEEDNQIVVEAKGPMFRIGFIKVGALFGGDSPKLTIKVPEDYKQNLEIAGSSGNIRLHDLAMKKLSFETSSGKVDLANIVSSEIQGETSSGNISVDFTEFHTDVQLTSSSGDIDLRLNDNQPNVTLEAVTASGSTNIDFPMEGSNRGKRTSGTIGDGEHQVRLKTSSGNITFRP